METYAWELQRPHGGLWFPVGGDHAAGVEKSDLPPMEFARTVGSRLGQDGVARVCVWRGESGVGRLPAATWVVEP